MWKKQHAIHLLMLILSVTTLAYLASNIFGDQYLSNYLSPLATLCAGVLILVTLKRAAFFNPSWILLAIMALFWGIADLVWMILYNFYGLDPESSNFLLYLYILPNLFLVLSGIFYFKRNLKKWHRFQLVLDGLITFVILSIMLSFSVYEFLVHSNLDIHDYIANLSYLILDLIAIEILVVLLMSARVSSLSATMIVTITGYTLYVLADLAYVYKALTNTYVPNSFIDSAYVLSIVIFGFSAYFEWVHPTLRVNPDLVENPENIGGNRRLLYLLAFPLILSLSGIMKWQALLLIAFFMGAYYYISNHSQTAIKTESQLMTERLINEKLEEIVNARTKALQESYRKLEKIAMTDMLSDLYNRRYLIGKLDALLLKRDTYFSFYYLDLDHFKVINDIHGHEMGDEVLKVISTRLYNWRKENLTIARLGGDEFGIIHLQAVEDGKASCASICKEIFELLSDKVVIGDYAFDVSVSIGISRYPYDAMDRESLIKHADLAMYQAKKINGDDRFVFYNHHHGAAVERRNQVELYLKQADFDRDFSLHYQPQFKIADQSLIGVEALIRWHQPEIGMVSPAEFIPVSEETGMIIRIGKWVIDKAFEQIAIWNSDDSERSINQALRMSINLSPLQFDSVDFFPYIQERMAFHNVKPEWIDFEITENSAMNSGTIMEEIFTALSGLGVSISVDDFGTGYSSLSYIKRFDLDELKIAKELIDHIVENQEERLIIKAIILMAQGMGLSTIAEGVETEDQLVILKELGCDAIQGYLYSRPITAGEFESKYL